LTLSYGPVITAPVGAFVAALAPHAADRQQNRLDETGPGGDPSIGRMTETHDRKLLEVERKLQPGRLERGTKMFAVFKTGGKQYRVNAEDLLKVGKVKGEPGEIVEFGEVLVVGGDSLTLGAPTVPGASVAAEVLKQAREPKVIAFKKRRRKNSRRKIGHRQEFTLLRITEILTDGKKPTKQAQPKRAAAAAPEGATEAAGPARKASAKKEAKPKAKPAAKDKKPAKSRKK
jgi:large subunit ribosomal protein L21